MIPPCSKSPDGRHNFAITGGDCVNGCGTNQAMISGGMKRVAQVNPFERALQRATMPKVQKRGAHTELHDLIGQLMEQFHEPPTITVGNRTVRTFPYYLGRLKKVPLSLIYQWRSEIKQSPDIRNEGKIFWWKYRQWWKEQPKKSKKPRPP